MQTTTHHVPAAIAVPAAAVAAKRAGNQALAMIAVFKLLKAILFFAVAFGLLHMVGKDTEVELRKFVHVFRIDSDRAFIKNTITKAADFKDNQKMLAGIIAAISGCAFCVEGVGLLMRKKWAEYFTVILTSLGIPIELYEIFHRTAHVTNSQVIKLVPEEQRTEFVFDKMMLLKIGALLLNSLIVWFLLAHLKRTRHDEKALEHELAAVPDAAEPAAVASAGGTSAEAMP